MTPLRTLLAAALLAAPAFAQEPVLLDGFEDCIAGQAAIGAQLGPCVTNAQNACIAFEPGSPGGLACYRAAKEEWGARISDTLARGTEELDETGRAAAGIEVKYSVLRNLLACDRQLELMALIEGQDPEGLAYLRAQCEATAVATSLVELLMAMPGQ